MTDKLNLIFNMETADPDDTLTLCMLSNHPHVNLKAVIVNPGSIRQTSLVNDILLMLDKPYVHIGARNPAHPKDCVSEFHRKWLADNLTLGETEAHGLGEDIIASMAKAYGDNLKIVSGAALSCIARYIEKYNATLPEVFCQGGFAGQSVVPEQFILPKFAGKETCPSFNLNADIPAAKLVASTNRIKRKYFISKNVCHGVIYDQEMHERIKPHRHNNIGLNMMVDGMEYYLKHKPSGKAFHDPLAACAAIDPSIIDFREVEIYREKGEWGSRLADGSNTFISISYDREKFEKVLVGV